MTWRAWDAAWQEALYGPRGFYRSTRPADHFATSAQGIPHAGPILACALATLARRHGLVRVVDVGAGNGELLRELTAQSTDLDLVGVEVVNRPDDLPDEITWWRTPDDALLPPEMRHLEHTLVVAHEWLDDLPCRVAEHDGQVWREVQVDDDGTECLGGPLTGDDLTWGERYAAADPQPGDRLEIGHVRDTAYAALCAALHHGVVLAVDYGYRAGTQPPPGTLTGYREGRQCVPVPDGSCNLTAHVCVDSLGADTLSTQRDMLDTLDCEPAAPANTLAHVDPPAYLQALAERSAWAALRGPGGLGDFWWVLSEIGRPGSGPS